PSLTKPHSTLYSASAARAPPRNTSASSTVRSQGSNSQLALSTTSPSTLHHALKPDPARCHYLTRPHEFMDRGRPEGLAILLLSLAILFLSLALEVVPPKGDQNASGAYKNRCCAWAL